MEKKTFKINIYSKLINPTEAKVFIGLRAEKETLTQGSIIVEPEGFASLEFNEITLKNNLVSEVSVSIDVYYSQDQKFLHKTLRAQVINNIIKIPSEIIFYLE